MSLRRWHRESIWSNGWIAPEEETRPRSTFTSIIRGDIATFVLGGLYTDWEASSVDLRERFRTGVEIGGDRYDDIWTMLSWLRCEFGSTARMNFRVRGDSDRRFNEALGVVEMKTSQMPIDGHAWDSGFCFIEVDWSLRWVYDVGTFRFAREEDAVAFKLAFM